MSTQSILWRRLDQPGHDAARLFTDGSRWHLGGTAVFLHEGQPCRLDYLVICDAQWRTLSGRVSGWVGERVVEVELSVNAGDAGDGARRWQLNGQACPQVDGCVDLDLNFSPATNLLPVRRLGLETGQETEVRAAWLRFPSFTLEPLDQRYRCLGAGAYHYQSGDFVAELQVNEAGLVTRYPGGWEAEAGA